MLVFSIFLCGQDGRIPTADFGFSSRSTPDQRCPKPRPVKGFNSRALATPAGIIAGASLDGPGSFAAFEGEL